MPNTTVLGKVAMIPKGTWSAGTYNINDYVYYEPDNATYCSLKNGNTVTPSNDGVNWFMLCKGIGTETDNNYTDADKTKVSALPSATPGSDAGVALASQLNLHLNDLVPHAENVAITLYVSPNGDDSTGDGSQSNPFATVNHAINSLKKSLFAEIKIRVFPGDYSMQTIGLSNFSKQFIIITAFDGTNEVNVPNDNYKFLSIGISACDKVQIQGLRLMHDSSTYAYSAFITDSKWIQFFGIKSIEGNKTASGFGITQNSNVYFENCLCANKDVVVSCNFGSRVESKNWDDGSTNNNQGIWVHGGSIVSAFGTQPSATTPLHKEEGSEIFSDLPRSFVVRLTETSSPDTISIPITLALNPTEIQIVAAVEQGKQFSIGDWCNGTSSCASQYLDQNWHMSPGVIIQLDDGTGKYTIYTVSSATKDAIVLARNTSYTAISSQINLQVRCRC